MFVLSGLIVGLLAFGLSSFFLAVFIFIITRTKSHFSHLLSYPIPKISVSIVSFGVALKMVMSLGLLMFSENATISDVLEETYHFMQNINKVNSNKPMKELILLNEIDAQEYLLSVADKYRIPESELTVTRKNLEDYKKALEKYYEDFK